MLPSATRPPPRSLRELEVRVASLAGRSLGEIAEALGRAGPLGGLRGKGRAGQLLEAALGATGGASAVHDFPDLAVELKTVPVDGDGRPRESTYVCTLPVASADTLSWETSWVRRKLSHVLWVPITGLGPWPARRVGQACFWRPTAEQDDALRADFEALVGLIGAGGIEEVTAHAGRVLQLRPKAADSRARTVAHGPDGEVLWTGPRGFYLRARFTREILVEPQAMPGGIGPPRAQADVGGNRAGRPRRRDDPPLR